MTWYQLAKEMFEHPSSSLSSRLDSLINADAQVKRAVAAAEDAGKKYRENNSPANKGAWKNATDALDVERRRVVLHRSFRSNK